MRCIFCKSKSEESRTIEHIIPESMGNLEHVLPAGVICDGCNHYFGRKVERPLLETSLFRHLRAGMQVQNKRGRIPYGEITGSIEMPSYRLMGRFLAKVGLEVIAFKTLEVEDWNKEIVENPVLDELRNYARYNIGPDWPFKFRTLHPVNAIFSEGQELYEVLHEFNILVTKRQEFYIVLSLFGVEMVLNLGTRSLDGLRSG